jgi:hypothetical protein
LYVWSGTSWTDVGQIQGPAGPPGSTVFSGLTDVTLTSLNNGQLVKYNSTTGKWENFTPTYISGNQNISVQGDIDTFNGTTSLDIILKNITTAGIYNNVTVNSKGQVTGGANISYLTQASIATLTDVTLTSLANNQQLRYNSATSKWVNFTADYISATYTLNFNGDVSGSGPINSTIGLTLATVNTNIGTFGSATKIPVITVNGKGLVIGVSESNVTIVTTLAGLSDVSLATPTNNQLLRYNTTFSKWENFTPTYISANQLITFTTAGTDILQNNTVSSSGTSLSPNFTVTGLRDKALPALSAGFLKYSGTTWVFDSATYLTSFTETDPVFVSWRDTTRAANTVWAGPATGSPAAAAFRQLGVSEITGAAPLATPTFTGIPAAPTAALGTNTTQLATTAFVQAALTASGFITNLDSLTDVVITGTPATGNLLRFDGTNWVNWAPNYITNSQILTLGGDITGSGPLNSTINTTLATVNVNVGTFGNTTTIPVITVNAKGLVTGVSTATVATGVSSLAALTDVNLSANGMLANNQFIRYNSTSTKWENFTMPAYLTGNQSISFTASGDVSNTTVSSATNLTPSITVNGIKGVVIPTLAAGFLKYTGSAWIFDNSTYITSAVTTISFGTTGLTPASATTGPVTVAGTLNVANGGTGATTLTGVLVGNGTSAVTAITGTANQLLRRNAGNTAYEFFTPPYLTANQAISFTADNTGDVTNTTVSSASALTPILTLKSIVTAQATSSLYAITYDAKGRITAGVAATPANIVTALGYTPINSTLLGAANGVATLGSDSKILPGQLPSYVDDVIESINFATLSQSSGETGKIYVTLDTNKVYRWSGSTYVEVSPAGVNWGAIGGNILDQGDLQIALGTKEPTITAGTTSQYWRGDKTWQTLPVYSLPIASASVLGGVRQGSGVTIDGSGIISVSTNYQAPLSGTGFLRMTGTTPSYVTGTASQFVKANGTLDSNAYTTNTGTVTQVLVGTNDKSGITLSVSPTTPNASSYTISLSGALALTSLQVTQALGYTPYNSSNPNGYNTGTVTNIAFTSGNGTTTSGGSISTNGTITIGATTDNIRINSLGVGTSASGVSGRINAADDIVGFSSSDIRLKKDISILENATEALSKLRGVSYVWDPQSFDVHGYTGKDYGIIAQDVEKVFPEMVDHRDNGYMAVRYERLIGVLVAAVNELSEKVKTLENK